MSNIKFNMDLPGLEGCESLSNGIVLDAYDLVISRCWVPLNKTQRELNSNAKLTSIKFIQNSSALMLNVQDTLEYINYNGNNQVDDAGYFWGPEDARLFEFQNELFLYYCMTNPKSEFPTRSMEILKLSEIINADSKPLRGNFIHPQVFDRPANPIEKNWLFFGNKKTIHIVYSLKPFIFGDLLESTFVARFQREYLCLSNFEGVHFGSNAITLNNNGKNELMFIFNDRSTLTTYISYFGFMEAEKPFRLLRVSKIPIDIEVPHNRLLYPSGVSIKSKKRLFAELTDTVVISGGIDDVAMFKKEISISQILKQEYKMCNNRKEFEYFDINLAKNQSNEICAFYHVPVFLICVFSILLILFLVIFKRHQKCLDKTKNLHDA